MQKASSREEEDRCVLLLLLLFFLQCTVSMWRRQLPKRIHFLVLSASGMWAWLSRCAWLPWRRCSATFPSVSEAPLTSAGCGRRWHTPESHILAASCWKHYGGGKKIIKQHRATYWCLLTVQSIPGVLVLVLVLVLKFNRRAAFSREKKIYIYHRIDRKHVLQFNCYNIAIKIAPPTSCLFHLTWIYWLFSGLAQHEIWAPPRP